MAVAYGTAKSANEYLEVLVAKKPTQDARTANSRGSNRDFVRELRPSLCESLA